MAQPVLEYESVSKVYRSFLGRKEHHALQDFSLRVYPGEIVGFLGPNGAGKTTAIHIALALNRPSSGKGTLFGKPFGDVQSRRRVGFLAENVAFYHLPAKEIIRVYGALNGVREPVLSREAKRLLDEFDIADVADRSIAKFSRGMLQRIGLAQALINDPDLLMLDEPTSALDPASRITVRNLLIRAREAGKSVFLSSHLLSELEMICDRIVVLNRGRIVLEGHTRELLESYEQCEIVLRRASKFALPAAAKNISSNNGELRFNVPRQLQREVIETAWKTGAELVSVNSVRRTLEELFLETTGEDTHKGEAKA
ncbi:MAG TPA: ABC transporter ATP-binding protein [Terriglobales bacterium]